VTNVKEDACEFVSGGNGFPCAELEIRQRWRSDVNNCPSPFSRIPFGIVSYLAKVATTCGNSRHHFQAGWRAKQLATDCQEQDELAREVPTISWESYHNV
jgi:hypothetical protein